MLLHVICVGYKIRSVDALVRVGAERSDRLAAAFNLFDGLRKTTPRLFAPATNVCLDFKTP